MISGQTGAYNRSVESRESVERLASLESRASVEVLEPVEPVEPVEPAEPVEWLIDNAEAYARLFQSLRRARQSIRIVQLALDPDCVAHHGSVAGTDAPSHCDGANLLMDTLLAAAGGKVEVLVLLNATLLLDTSKALRRFLAAAGPCGIQVRGTGRFPHILHAKAVIIDGTEAFLIGSPFVNGYWDDRRHRPVDVRRPLRELAGRPLHDVSVRMAGSVVDDLDALFCELWNATPARGGDRSARLEASRAHASLPVGGPAVRLVRTAPPGVLPSMRGGATEILEACLEGIGSARSLIYIEHQYLSARPVVDALVAALRREADLEIIAVLNQNADVTAYRAWQTARLAESGLLQHPHVGLFALWSSEPDEHGQHLAINQVFVHSKVLIVDDRWATTGSANLDGVSLHSYGDDFTSWPGRRLFRDVRNIDANVVVDDTRDGVRVNHTVVELRRRLWSEHLGVSAADVAAPPPGGWLALWRACASRNVIALSTEVAGTTTGRMRGFVLPYSPRAAPVEQLADIGVRMPSAGLNLCFNPGWLEVNFSPNWVRNMFS